MLKWDCILPKAENMCLFKSNNMVCDASSWLLAKVYGKQNRLVPISNVAGK